MYSLMRQKYILLLLLMCAGSARAQSSGATPTDTVLQHYINAVNKDSIMAHLRILAADSYAGRGVFEEGCEKAMMYLAKEFERRNLQKFQPEHGYRQPFVLQNKRFSKCYLETPKRNITEMKIF